MKKYLMILLTLLTVLSLTFAVACKENPDNSSESSSVVETQKTIVSVEPVSGMPETVYALARPSLKDLVIKVVYDDGSSEEISYGDTTKADFSVECDTSELGESTVTVSYKGVSFSATIEVIFDVESVALPGFVNDFNAQKAENSVFVKKDQVYAVGDEGLFYFSPVVISFVGEELITFDEPGEVEIVASLQMLNGETYEDVEMANYAEVDAKMASFDFTDEAVGKTFKLSVYPAVLTSEYQIKNFTKEFEFRVVDGYNVNSAKDLLLWDNVQEEVASLRAQKGVTADASQINGLILHTNIYLSAEDIPEEFLYDKERDSEDFAGLSAEKQALLQGSLKDWTLIFQRNIGDDGKFNFEGNYFTIDASAVPFVMREGDDVAMTIAPTSIVCHATLFTIDGNASTNGGAQTENFNVANVNLIGNLNRQEVITSSGGLIYIKARKCKGEFNNVIAKRWYSAIFAETNAVGHEVSINDSILQDSYNSLIYSWGSLLNINNSIVSGAGGPAIIADHANPTNASIGRTGSYGWASELNIDEKSTIASYVTGQESWFLEFNASSAVAQIKDLDTLFNAFGNKTFITAGTDGQKLINLAIVFKSGDAEGMIFDPIKGKATIGAHNFNFEGAYTAPFLAGFAGRGAPIFQSTTEAGILAYAGQQEAPYQALPILYSLTGAQTMTPVGFDFSTGAPVPTENLPIFFQDTGYVNLFYATPGSSGYLGVILGSYRAR